MRYKREGGVEESSKVLRCKRKIKSLFTKKGMTVQEADGAEQD